jgi:hypothetical protein
MDPRPASHKILRFRSLVFCLGEPAPAQRIRARSSLFGRGLGDFFGGEGVGGAFGWVASEPELRDLAGDLDPREFLLGDLR